MTQQQKVWFALLGADIEMFDKYMADCNDIAWSIKLLYKYDRLSEAAIDWAAEQGLLNRA